MAQTRMLRCCPMLRCGTDAIETCTCTGQALGNQSQEQA